MGRSLDLVLLDEDGKDWVSKVAGKRVRIIDEGITVQERLLSPETKSNEHEKNGAEAEAIENN